MTNIIARCVLAGTKPACLQGHILVSRRNKNTGRGSKRELEKTNHSMKTSLLQVYDYFLVTDFEATCEASKILMKYEQEIIEFPVYKVRSTTFEIEEVFHSFVRPTINPIISNFCSKLTGISQLDITNQPTLREVLESFHTWMIENILKKEKKFIFVTSGDWDLRQMLSKECQLKDIQMPLYFHPYINVNKSFASAIGKWPRFGKGRINAMLRLLDLKPTGHFHQGTSDCENIIEIMKALADRGHVFRPTSQ